MIALWRFWLSLFWVTTPLCAHDRDVALPAQPAPLAGTLTEPDDGARHPAALIIAGSGPTDRDGNQPGLRNDAYRKLADGLAACGIAALRTDKRGIAMSREAEPDESNLVVETYVRDTLAWLDRLRAEPRVASVSLIGHSEGALIATLAAQRTHVARLVLIAGAGRKFGALLRGQLDTLAMPPRMRDRADRMITLLERGETLEDPPPGLGLLFRPSVQPYLISLMQIDPVAALAATEMPALVVQGTTDLQIGLADARRLAAARPGVRLVVIDGMNHVLRAAPADPAANLATYGDIAAPLAPALLPALCSFMTL